MGFDDFDDKPQKKSYPQPVMRKNISELIPPPIPTLLEKKMGRPQEVWTKLDDNIEDVIEWILQGVSMRDIAKKLGLPYSSFFYWRKHSNHSATITEVLTYSAEEDQQKAEDILKEAIGTEEESIAQVMIRKELSQFYRWRASKRMPKLFGNNATVDHNHKIKVMASDEQFDKLIEVAAEAGMQTPAIDVENSMDEPEKNYIDYEEFKLDGGSDD